MNMQKIIFGVQKIDIDKELQQIVCLLTTTLQWSPSISDTKQLFFYL